MAEVDAAAPRLVGAPHPSSNPPGVLLGPVSSFLPSQVLDVARNPKTETQTESGHREPKPETLNQKNATPEP